jgi:O-antigen ligase
MATAAHFPSRNGFAEAVQSSAIGLLRPLHALMSAPSLLFLAALAAMLFRPPDMQFYWLDRFAFLLLVFVVMLRVLALRLPVNISGPVTLPMLALLLLALSCVMVKPYDSQNWSVFAAKWLVPFALYHLAGLVFTDAASLRRFETFTLTVLAYLSVIAILFLLDAKALIFPRYILDESIGIHADRARGPFLQAVANGMALNMLGLVALNAFRRRRLGAVPALFFLIALPLAMLATKTRAVWLSFVGSVLVLVLLSSNARVRRACLALCIATGLGVCALLSMGHTNASLADRLQEASPVEFRMAVYRAGWQMFTEKPLSGWGAHNMERELARNISDFHQEAFFMHNTFLEIAVEHGLLGLGLYLWLIVGLFRVGRRRRPRDCQGCAFPGFSFLDQDFRSLWPVLLGVYLLNACFVVMNYQFVNGFLFTVAGMLAAQNRRYSPPLFTHCLKPSS